MSADTPPGEQRENPEGRRLGNDRRWSNGPPPDGEDRRTEEDRRGGARREEEKPGRFGALGQAWRRFFYGARRP